MSNDKGKWNATLAVPVISTVKTKDTEESSDQSNVYTFYMATTLPDRCSEYDEDDNKIVDGEILSVSALEDMRNYINDTTRMGGKAGSYRTVSLFHDRVLKRDLSVEEAGYIKPNSRVVPHKDYPD